ncbi:MAG: signal peptidase II [Firmicutes bacterium]|nr:signal peptidase II [Bacillota bacterium]
MEFVLLSVFAALIVAADQITKYLTVLYIPLYGSVPVWPGVVGLTYVRNTGAAFSLFEGQQWLFIALFAVLTVGIWYFYFKKPLGLTRFEWGCVAAIYGGGLANMVDRIRLGYVVDMIRTEFIDFPVFNLADSFITCGCILLVAHMLLCNRAFWKGGEA